MQNSLCQLLLMEEKINEYEERFNKISQKRLVELHKKYIEFYKVVV